MVSWYLSDFKPHFFAGPSYALALRWGNLTEAPTLEVNSRMVTGKMAGTQARYFTACNDRN